MIILRLLYVSYTLCKKLDVISLRACVSKYHRF